MPETPPALDRRLGTVRSAAADDRVHRRGAGRGQRLDLRARPTRSAARWTCARWSRDDGLPAGQRAGGLLSMGDLHPAMGTAEPTWVSLEAAGQATLADRRRAGHAPAVPAAAPGRRDLLRSHRRELLPLLRLRFAHREGPSHPRYPASVGELRRYACAGSPQRREVRTSTRVAARHGPAQPPTAELPNGLSIRAQRDIPGLLWRRLSSTHR